MMKPRPAVIAYLIAAFAALAMAFGQIWSALAGRPLMVSRTGVLVEQFTSRAVSDPATYWPIALYVLLLITSHLLFFVITTALWRAACLRFRPANHDCLLPLTAFLLFCGLLLALWNVHVFPLSRAFPGIDVLLMQTASPLLFWGGSVAIAAVLAAGLFAMVVERRPAWPSVIAIIAIALWIPAWLHRDGSPGPAAIPNAHATAPLAKGSTSSPNIVLIGIDSLRPDFLPAYDYPDRKLTPHINALVDDLVLYDDTVTPLARTFVSYMSLLTGQYPVRHGVRFNLYPRALFQRSDTLAHRLRNAGYATAYGTDETRFANFDASFGFDFIATPPASINDFLVGASYDTALTNLMAITPAGRWLAPHLHGNRAAYRQYSPGNHADRVDRLITSLPRDRPAFLISHYCLPHWPFVHDVQDYGLPMPREPEGDWADAPNDYLRALQAADAQIGRNIATLRRTGRLEDAIIVVYSDHGEGLSMGRDALAASGDGVQALKGHGHGSEALGDNQQRVLLGMQRFVDGRPVWLSRHVRTPASLIDLAPTLITAIGLPNEPSTFDGIDLAPATTNPAATQPDADRMRFVETGLSSAVVETDKIDEDAVAREFAHLYTLQDDMRIEIDPAYLPSRMAAKQRGVYWQHYALATIRGFTRDRDCWVLADFKARELRCVQDPVSDPVAGPMRMAACRHFASDPGFAERWCANTGDMSPAVAH